jgi:hypothetical protein
MRFMITAQSGASEKKANADQAFDENLFAAYMKFNEDMHKSGVLVASEGLNPGGPRARVEVIGGKRTVVDGPYAESKELVGGFYLIDVKSKEEAIEWALRCPVGMGTDDVLEVHQMTEASDIPEELRKIIAKVAPTWSAFFLKSR